MDMPMHVNSPKGPAFDFSMVYRTDDNRSRAGRTWPLGYRWAHRYELAISRTGNTYQFLGAFGGGPKFQWTGSAFEEHDTADLIGYSRMYELTWDGSNLVAYVPSWNRSAADGHTGGCGGGKHNQVDHVEPPEMAWHAAESFTFTPSANNSNHFLLSVVTARDGRSLYIGHATNDAITEIRLANSNLVTFGYAPSGLMTNIHDHTGNRDVHFAYSGDGMSEVTDMGGIRFEFAYDGDGRVTYFATPSDDSCCSNITTVAYSPNGVTATYMEGNQSWVYITNGVGVDGRSGLGETTLHYDETTSGTRIFRRVDPLGRTKTALFPVLTNASVNGLVSHKVNSDGSYQDYAYDDLGRATTIQRFTQRAELLSVTTIARIDFPGTQCPSNVVEDVHDGAGVLLSRSSTTFDRYDWGTTNIRDDVYVKVSDIQWSATNIYQQTRFLWDTNTFDLVAVQRLTNASPALYRTDRTFLYDEHGCVAAIEDALGHRMEYTYDVLDRLIGVGKVMTFGTNVTSNVYDDLNRLTETIYPDGSSESWTHAPCGCGVLTHVDRVGTTTTNAYDGNGRLSTTETRTTNDTLVGFAAFEYDAGNNRTKVMDALGFTVTNVFNAASQQVAVWDPLGRATFFRFNGKGQQYATVHADGTVTSNHFDFAGRVLAVSRYASEAGGPMLTSASYAYDGLGRRLATTDALGNVTSNAYDLRGRVTQVTYPDGAFAETAYDLVGNAVARIGPVLSGASASEMSAATTTNQYDILDRLAAETDPEGRTTRYEYDPDWDRQVRYVINANGITNRISLFEPLTGRLATNIADGLVLGYSYDAAGKLLRMNYPDGTFMETIYDGPRQTSQHGRSGNATSFTYDDLNRRVLITNGRGFSSSNAYDAVGNMLTATDPLTNTTSFGYDSMNRLIVTTFADGRSSTNTYDLLGRLVAKTGAGAVPVFYAYDAAGRMTGLTDGEGNDTGFSYDALGRLVKKTHADNTFYAYGYNARGWLTNRVDAMERSTSYAYNNVGQLTLVDYLTDADVAYAYDALGRMTSRSDAAGVWAWTYDAESPRVLAEATPFGQTVSYGYQAGTFDLASVGLDATNTTYYAWNAGRLTNVTWHTGQASYQYLTGADLVEQLTFSEGEALTISRAYDAADRLTLIAASNGLGQVNAFAYALDVTGRRTAREDADGSRTDWGYDPFDQLTSAARTNGPNGAADAAYQFNYQYDLVGNRLHEDRGRQDLDGTFNNLNQLTHLTYGGQLNILGSVSTTNAYVLVQGYTNAPPFYDETNWLGGAVVGPGSNSVPIVAWEGTNSTHSNLVVHLPPTNPQQFAYDANGNLTSDGQRAYAWDEENRLLSVESLEPAVPAALRTRVDFLYDGMGRRVSKTSYSSWGGASYGATNITRFVYDGWNLLAELTTVNVVSNYYCWGLDISGSLQGAGGIGGLLATMQQGAPPSVLFAYDGNGNVKDVVGSSGVTVAYYEYDPFGRTVAQLGSYADTNPWRFSTKQFEVSGDLYYYGFRYYAPETGKWLSRDPIGETGFRFVHQRTDSLSYVKEYLFLQNKPTSFVDVLGLGQNDPPPCAPYPDCLDYPPPPEPDPNADCLNADGLPNTAPECDAYGDETYLGTSLRCFCKCADNGMWSQKVRGCLSCMAERGVDTGEAHRRCYQAASDAGHDRPEIRLGCCYFTCIDGEND